MTSPSVLIDRRGHLAQLVVQALCAAAAFVAASWIPLAVAGIVFGVSAVVWPRGALVLRLHASWTRGRGASWLDDGRPPRMSTALAAVTFAGAAAAVAAGADTTLWAALLLMAAALVAEAVAGACIPCEIVVWAARRGLLPFRSPIGETS